MQLLLVAHECFQVLFVSFIFNVILMDVKCRTTKKSVKTPLYPPA